jgi:hypothetical protein
MYTLSELKYISRIIGGGTIGLLYEVKFKQNPRQKISESLVMIPLADLKQFRLFMVW